MALHNSPRIVKDRLILNVDAADPNSYPGSGNYWYDTSGNQRSGSISGATYSTFGGGSMFFNGGQKVSFGSISIGAQQTIELWFYSTSVTNYKNPFDMNFYDGYTNMGPRFEQSTDPGYPSFGCAWRLDSGGGSNLNGFGPIPLTVSTWYQFVFTLDCGKVFGYLNSNSVSVIYGPNSSFAYGYPIVYNIPVLGVGCQSSRYFYGYEAIFRLYSKALSAAEILQNYTAHKRRFGLT